jgi:DNA invertase Pin-like site-specific DNA recombinase
MSSVLQLDMLAAIAKKDYEDRRNRQQQAVARAKAEGKYLGRKKDTEKRKIITSLLKSGLSYSETQVTAKCSRQLIEVMAKEAKKYSKKISLIVRLLLIK